MAEWSTAASLATAVGTLVLVLATFVAVRAANAGGDIGFWQGSLRDPEDPDYAALLGAVTTRRLFEVEVLYSDHEGGQRAIGRFGLAPFDDGRWLCSVVRRWNLDRPDPRPPQQ